MRINGNPNAIALQHMVLRAQEARKMAAPSETAATASAEATSAIDDTSTSGNNVPATGENLPPTSGPEHATGLERAIERLQTNVEKNTQAKGLLNALEMLQRNLERSGSHIETQA